MRGTRPGVSFRRWRNVGRSGLALLTALILAATFLPLTAAAAPAQSMGGEEWARVYTVRPMDTLAAIAMRFDVSQEALMRANGLRNPNVIYVGQQLIIPERDEMGWSGMGRSECADYHKVRRGDTLSEIALYYGMDAYELARANGMYDLNEIYVGQNLCIPGSKGMGGPTMDMSMQPERPMGKPEQMPMPKNEMPMEPERPMGQPNQSMGQPNQSMGEPQRDMMREPDRPMNNGPMNDEPMRDGPMMDGPSMDGPMKDGPSMDGPMRPDGNWQEPMGPEPMGPMKGGSDEYWTGSYFADKYFSEFVEERKDLEIRFNWFTGGPFNNMPQDRFSVRWEKIEYFNTGNYRFFAVADDGVRVYVDDQLIIDGWKIQPATEYKGDIFLREGRHKLVVEYYEEAEDAQIHVYWEPLRKR